MRSNLATALKSKEVQSLDGLRPQMAKAVQVSPTAGLDSIRRSLMAAFGSMKAASIAMRIDQSQLNREIETARFNFGRLMVETVTQSERAKFYQQMHEEHEPLVSPLARLRDNFKRQRELQDEAMQIAEGLAS